jgi:hypothetical protein
MTQALMEAGVAPFREQPMILIPSVRALQEGEERYEQVGLEPPLTA